MRLRVFGGSGIPPLLFPACGCASMPTCFALAPVRRLSLVLGPISFWLGFAPCLRILFARCGCRRAYCGPRCGCRRAYCGPHCARESERVLASLPWFFPFRGLSPTSRLLLGLWPSRSRSPIPSLAPSWWSPCPLLRWALLTLYGCVLSLPSAFSLHRSRLSIPFAISPLSRRVFTDGISPLRAVALADGRLPRRWVPSEPMGLALAPPISPYTGPGQSPRICCAPLGAQVGVSYFYCGTFR